MTRFIRVAMLLVLFVAPGAHGQASEPKPRDVRYDAPSDVEQTLSATRSPDARVRTDAMRSLMMLPTERLPELRDAVGSAWPLTPQQQLAVQDAFLHIQLRPEPRDGGHSLLGTQQQFGDARVTHRLRGFIAYVVLDDGDEIIALEEAPDVTIRSADDLNAARGRFRAGKVVHFIVDRGGERLRVRVPLGPRPDWLNDNDVDLRQRIEMREARAMAAWKQWIRTARPDEPN